MKAIQTFLSSKHLRSRSADYWWTDEKYRCLSFALSCLQLTKNIPDVTLITDREGKELLIDTFNLPYRHVQMVLDELTDIPFVTEGLAKVFSWSLSDGPFFFVDETVFLWNPLPEEILRHEFFVFNEERNNDAVLNGLFSFQKKINNIPSYLLNVGRPKHSVSTRIVGGTGDIFKKYFAFVRDFINDRVGNDFDTQVFGHGEMDPIFLNYLIAQFCNKASVPAKSLFEFAIDDRAFTPFTVFEPVHPVVRLSYIPDGLKSDLNTQCNLSFMMQSLYPEVHARISDYFNNKNPLKVGEIVPGNWKPETEKDFFVRTLKAIDLLHPKSETEHRIDNFSSQNIDSFITVMAESDEKKLVQDVFGFERTKYEFHRVSKNGLLSASEKNFHDYRKLFLDQEVDIHHSSFVCPENIRLVESSWKWGIYTNIEALYPLRVVYNFALPAGYFQTLLWFNPETDAVAEYDLEQFDMLLLDSFQNPSSLEDAFNNMSRYFEEGRDGLETLKFFAQSRLKELFLMGAIVLTR